MFLLFNCLNLFQFSFLFYSVIAIKEENENLTNKGDLSQFDSSGCGLTKGCLFKPPNCNPYNDCSYALSYISDDERVYFELLAQVAGESNVWAAVGFSVDGLMGGDTVTDCSSLEGRDYKARLSYNPGKSNRKAPLAYGLESKILHTHHAKVADGIIYCRFSQLIQPPESVQPQFVRPLNAPIFILLASGVTRGKDLTIHSLNSDSSLFPFSSPHPIQLTKFNLSPEELANGDWEINKYNDNFINSSLNLTKELSIPFNENNSSSPVIEQTTTNDLKIDSTTTPSTENINNINEEKSSTKILEKENQKNNLNNENISLNSNPKNDCSDSGITSGTTTNKPEIGSDAFLTSNNSEFRLIKTHGD